MEANLVRILVLIALFFLLSSDYSSLVRQLVPTFDNSEEDVESGEIGLASSAASKIPIEKTQENAAVKAGENESKFLLGVFVHFFYLSLAARKRIFRLGEWKRGEKKTSSNFP